MQTPITTTRFKAGRTLCMPRECIAPPQPQKLLLLSRECVPIYPTCSPSPRSCRASLLVVEILGAKGPSFRIRHGQANRAGAIQRPGLMGSAIVEEPWKDRRALPAIRSAGQFHGHGDRRPKNLIDITLGRFLVVRTGHWYHDSTLPVSSNQVHLAGLRAGNKFPPA